MREKVRLVAEKGADWKGRNFKRAFAQHSLESQEMGKHLFARIHKMIRVEMKNVLKESTVTVTNSDRDVFTTRTWESHYTELQRIAPVLLGILDACIPKHSSRSWRYSYSCQISWQEYSCSFFHIIGTLFRTCSKTGICMIMQNDHDQLVYCN